MKQFSSTEGISSDGRSGEFVSISKPSTNRRNQTFGARARRMAKAMALAAMLVLTAGLALGYYARDDFLVAGYAPRQPVEFSHQLHSGELGLDCRFCHSTADLGATAGLPSLGTCMSCHDKILPDSIKLLPIRASFAEGKPFAWVRVCKLPDFAYFDHSIHLNAQIECVTCHGHIDRMQRTELAVAHTMEFCLNCHRNPTAYLPNDSSVYAMRLPSEAGGAKSAAGASANGSRLPSPPTHCSGCHR